TRNDFTMPANDGTTVSCPSLTNTAPTLPTVVDNCGNTLTASAPVVSAQVICSGTRTYTYTYTDCAGHTHNWVYTYTVTADVQAPVITSCPADVNLGCNPTSWPTGTAIATDNCTSTPTITSILNAEVGTGCNRTRTRTYTATDACGNTAT